LAKRHLLAPRLVSLALLALATAEAAVLVAIALRGSENSTETADSGGFASGSAAVQQPAAAQSEARPPVGSGRRGDEYAIEAAVTERLEDLRE
jgi:hypothetical protein